MTAATENVNVADVLAQLTVKLIDSIADEFGVEATGKKAEKIAALVESDAIVAVEERATALVSEREAASKSPEPEPEPEPEPKVPASEAFFVPQTWDDLFANREGVSTEGERTLRRNRDAVSAMNIPQLRKGKHTTLVHRIPRKIRVAFGFGTRDERSILPENHFNTTKVQPLLAAEHVTTLKSLPLSPGTRSWVITATTPDEVQPVIDALDALIPVIDDLDESPGRTTVQQAVLYCARLRIHQAEFAEVQANPPTVAEEEEDPES